MQYQLQHQVNNFECHQRSKNDANVAKRSDWSKNTTAQRKVVAVAGQQKLVKKLLEDQAEALTEIQVEEKQVAEIKNKIHTVKNSLDTALKPNIRGGM